MMRATGLRHFRIGSRLALGFASLLLLMVVVTVMSLVLPSGPRKAVDKAVSLANEKSMLITAMRQGIIVQGLLAHDIAFPHDSDVDTPFRDMARILKEQRNYETAQSQLLNKPLSEPEMGIIRKLQMRDGTIRPVLAEADEWVQAFNPGQAARVLAEKATPPQQINIELLNHLNELQNTQIRLHLEEFHDASSRANRALVAGTAVVLALAGVIAWLLTQSIVRPLTDAVDAARRVANGDLDDQPVEHHADEPGQLLAALAHMTTRLKEARRMLEMAARQDGLTGLANRRHFDESLQHEWQRLGRLAQEPGIGDGRLAQLALLLIDVDFFKKFNDTYGHQVGDTCLRTVAGVIGGASLREGDVAARYGGEEFAVILPGIDGRGAAIVAERIREAMAAHPVPGIEPARTVTVSIGVAAVTPGAPHTPAQLVAAADAALYRAKHAGRDRVSIAPPILAALPDNCS
jgi:diguanylate cyclase (GGDEF)-like protein